eukprot:g7402.t1
MIELKDTIIIDLTTVPQGNENSSSNFSPEIDLTSVNESSETHRVQPVTTTDNDASEATPASQAECVVCYETYNKMEENFPTLSDCKHEPTVCKGCLDKHVLEEMNGKGNIEDLKCPSASCTVKFTHSDVKKVTQKSTFERYDDILTKRFLSKMSNFTWCKAEGCGSGQCHLDEHRCPIMTCSACGRRSCFTHNIPWHEGQTCTQYDEALAAERDGDRLNMEYIRRVGKQCPSCKIAIEKNDGCDHMTCRNCGHEFCWLCLADWGPINRDGCHRHRRTCRHFRRFEP